MLFWGTNSTLWLNTWDNIRCNLNFLTEQIYHFEEAQINCLIGCGVKYICILRWNIVKKTQILLKSKSICFGNYKHQWCAIVKKYASLKYYAVQPALYFNIN